MYDYKFKKINLDSMVGRVNGIFESFGDLMKWPDNFEFVTTSDHRNAVNSPTKSGDVYSLEVDLPGVKPNGVTVEALVGERSVRVTSVRENNNGAATKTVKYSLPEDADVKFATAVLRDGVLTLRFPISTFKDVPVNIPVTI
jgi:HSP20 family molecular chaperone IbpA